MIALLSPARKFDLSPCPHPPLSSPAFAEMAEELAELLREFSPWELEGILRVNPELALQAAGYYQDFQSGAPGVPALLSYLGHAYRALDARTLDGGSLLAAGNRLRIVSAFYGLLRPLDGIQPYRLEFCSRLRVDGRSLYVYWGDRIARQLFQQCDTAVNLCSAEYAKAFLPHVPPGRRVITCQFLTQKGGRLRCMATASKMARGAMARFMVCNRLDRPRDLKEFAWEDYRFLPDLSSGDTYVFAQ